MPARAHRLEHAANTGKLRSQKLGDPANGAVVMAEINGVLVLHWVVSDARTMRTSQPFVRGTAWWDYTVR
jgi:hypothetical protein